jgi:hypothetical protein
MIKFCLGAARYRRLWAAVAGVAMTTGLIAAAGGSSPAAATTSAGTAPPAARRTAIP